MSIHMLIIGLLYLHIVHLLYVYYALVQGVVLENESTTLMANEHTGLKA